MLMPFLRAGNAEGSLGFDRAEILKMGVDGL
jgi:hypothetical protein